MSDWSDEIAPLNTACGRPLGLRPVFPRPRPDGAPSVVCVVCVVCVLCVCVCVVCVCVCVVCVSCVCRVCVVCVSRVLRERVLGEDALGLG